MKLVTRIWEPGEVIEGYGYAYLNVTAGLLDEIRRKREVVRRVESANDFVDIEFRFTAIEWFENGSDETCELTESSETCEVDARPEEGSRVPVESELLVMDGRGFYWTASVKHCGSRIESGFITYDKVGL